MIRIRIGDYFDVYQDGQPTRRMIALSDSEDSKYEGNRCNAMTINPVAYYLINVDNEVDDIRGNIFK